MYEEANQNAYAKPGYEVKNQHYYGIGKSSRVSEGENSSRPPDNCSLWE